MTAKDMKRKKRPCCVPSPGAIHPSPGGQNKILLCLNCNKIPRSLLGRQELAVLNKTEKFIGNPQFQNFTV